jgi:energy-converting hydrogenase A subunit M
VLAVFENEFKSLKIDINETADILMEKIDVDYVTKFKYPAKKEDQNYFNDKTTEGIIYL